MSWFSRLVNVFRSDRLNHDLENEVRFHLDSRADEFRRRGMTSSEAAREARRRLGNEWLARETSRDVKLLPWLDSMVRDARYGSRMLCKSPMVTATAILSLALAIGACTAAYSLIDALILRPLPVRDPEGLVYLTYPSDRPGAPDGDSFNYPLFERLRDASREKVELFGVSSPRPRDVTLGNSTEKIRVHFVSGEPSPSSASSRLSDGCSPPRMTDIRARAPWPWSAMSFGCAWAVVPTFLASRSI